MYEELKIQSAFIFMYDLKNHSYTITRDHLIQK